MHARNLAQRERERERGGTASEPELEALSPSTTRDTINLSLIAPRRSHTQPTDSGAASGRAAAPFQSRGSARKCEIVCGIFGASSGCAGVVNGIVLMKRICDYNNRTHILRNKFPS